MEAIPVSLLFAALGGLIVLSGCFSGSETALMSLNRYRMRHLAKQGHRGARIAERLLQRPDRVLGVILLGNNFVNIAASSLATLIALRLHGESAIAVAAGLLTLVILIFAEVAPKTLAAVHPERVAFPASYVLWLLLRLLYPLVWLVNAAANALLSIVRVRVEDVSAAELSQEELRTVVNEAGNMIPRRHRHMLVSILDLEEATVEDIMIPRTEIVGIDLDDPWPETLERLTNSQYTRMPVYRGTVDHVLGFVHVRRIVGDLVRGSFTPEDLQARLHEPFFIPEGTGLHTQLLKFQRQRERVGLVVDEYGEILGLAALDDILEEIVGEFTTDPGTLTRSITRQEDGTYLVEGSATIRELNRVLGWELSTSGPKTLNGLILERLETIPEAGTSLLIDGYPVTIVQTQGNRVKTAEIQPERPPSVRRES
ncbi:MAG: HlyC/CorC family transporter [Halorhodospira halophila]|uniref:HlyC/CorC family transporter n=1 Tax=Halorhodospira TaxID=85108 RepID=UPI00191404D0|nr:MULTISPECIES: HlyC/CorC family transporter [Halorhodospira]MBK5937665.1 magnesium/cobalt efflux protein [Halorhodospira halophila]MBK5942795.1 magnesium/cobalt efflux protein [Halorhodospira halophila]MCC3751881.1 HlyC/CorC family transporter [Halorhodospira halophila]MCG5529135.1 HlyC/CorC family transporter [Halorhodospira halophila]MCG5533702.1 HlyC/CorC family transporter [Halorhodospira sp. 9621]